MKLSRFENTNLRRSSRHWVSSLLGLVFLGTGVTIIHGCIFRPQGTNFSQAKLESDPGGRNSAASLTVLILVDQMRADTVERFRPVLQQDAENQGFLWLADAGVRFENTRTAGAPTVTAAGHASVCTGSAPAVHGIAANEFFDKSDSKTKALVSDPKARVVRSDVLLGSGPLEQSAPENGSSAWRLKSLTLGERLKLASQETEQLPSKTITVAIKDRSALLCGGSQNEGAYYFDPRSGSLVTSSETGKTALPDWVTAFNQNRRPESYGDWNLKGSDRSQAMSVLDAREYEATAEFLRSRTAKLGPFGEFPKRLSPKAGANKLEIYDRFVLMPAASDYVLDFALDAARHEKLGQTGSQDLLVISFSSPDLVGHHYGPSSLELVDTYRHLDATLNRLRKTLPQIVGHERITYVLTADHGIQQIPEALAATGSKTQRIDAKAFQSALNDKLSQDPRLGAGTWIHAVVTDQVFLNDSQIASRGLSPAAVSRELVQHIETLPGIFAAFPAQDVKEAALRLAGNQFSSRELAQTLERIPAAAVSGDTPEESRRFALMFLARGFQETIAGDIYIVPRSGWQFGYGITANHGTPWDGDSRIPWLMVGPALPKGQRLTSPVFADDIAATILELQGFKIAEITPGQSYPRAFENLSGQSRLSAISGVTK